MLSETAYAFSFLKADGMRIVDEAGQQVLLRGVNLGNWFLIEMWMLSLGNSGISDQYSLEQILIKRFGRTDKDRLLDIYREHYISDRDFTATAGFHVNYQRPLARCRNQIN